MLKLKLQYFDQQMHRYESLEKFLMLGKIESKRKGNIRILGIPDGDERGLGAETLIKEITTENSPDLRKGLDT